MLKLEPHFLATYLASEAACSILDIMPSTDLVEDLRNLIYIQHELFTHMVDGKHYGTDNINDFVNFTQDVKTQITRLKEQMEYE